jgi:hypothetical protein
VTVDGDFRLSVPADGNIQMRAGKHAIEVAILGRPPTTATVLVVPSAPVSLAIAPAEERRAARRNRWGPAVGLVVLGLAAGGVWWADGRSDPAVAR